MKFVRYSLATLKLAMIRLCWEGRCTGLSRKICVCGRGKLSEKNELSLLLLLFGFAPLTLTDYGIRLRSVDLEYVSVGDTDQFTPACVAAYETAFDEAKARGRNIRALIICNPHNPLG